MITVRIALMFICLVPSLCAMERIKVPSSNVSSLSHSENNIRLFDFAKDGDCDGVRGLMCLEAVNYKNPGGKTALHAAATNGHAGVVKELVRMGADTEAEDDRGWTPLHCAANGMKLGHLEVVNVLLPPSPAAIFSAVDVNRKTHSGLTALQLAYSRENISMVWLLLQAGASIKLDDYPIIFLAAQKGHAAVIIKLLAWGVPIDFRDKRTGLTGLMIASFNGHFSAVETLLEADASAEKVDNGGKTALHYAAMKNKDEIVRKLVEKSLKINIEDKDGMTPLHEAAAFGCQEVTNLLIARGAGINDTNKKGETALHVALEKCHEATAIQLIIGGADFNILSKNCEAAIHIASREGLVEVVETLIAQNACLDVTGRDNWTALHYAARGGFYQIVEALIHAGADSTIKANDRPQYPHGTSFWMHPILYSNRHSWKFFLLPISLAIRHNHERVAQLLLREIQLTNKKNEPVLLLLLHSSICKGDQVTALKLLQVGVPVNSKTAWDEFLDASTYAILSTSKRLFKNVNYTGWTALHYAVWFGEREIIAHLLLGADVNIQNSGGNTPLYFAIIKGHFEESRLLVGAKAHLNGESKGAKALPVLLQYDCSHNHKNCMKMLKLFLDSGAKLESIKELGLLPVSEGHSFLLTVVRLQRLGKVIYRK